MKVKYYMRGIGVGIILSVILFSVGNKDTNAGTTNQEIVKEEENTDGINLDFMKENKNISIAPTVTIEPGEESENTTSGIITVAPVESTLSPVPVESTPAPTPVESTPAQEPTSKPETKDDQNNDNKETEDIVSIKIENGMYSEKVAKALEEGGLIESWEEYNQYLQEKGYTKRIRSDIFKIKKGSSFEEITDIIMKH